MMPHVTNFQTSRPLFLECWVEKRRKCPFCRDDSHDIFRCNKEKKYYQNTPQSRSDELQDHKGAKVIRRIS